MRALRVGATAAAVLVLVGCAAPKAAPARAPTPSSPASTGPPRTVAALGDSLSNGFDACAEYGSCPAVSWATGTDPRVRSVADRLGAATGGPVSRINASQAGAVAADLDAQVDQVLPVRPDLATVLIGANDVCRSELAAMTPAADLRRSVARALQRLADGSPDTLVLIASVPDVTALLPAAADDETARSVWSGVGLCPTALGDPRSDAPAAEARRDAVRQRLREYDTALTAVCAELPRCINDAGALTAYRPVLTQLSALDRFHPSVAGLRALADIEWRAISRAPAARRLLGRGAG